MIVFAREGYHAARTDAIAAACLGPAYAASAAIIRAESRYDVSRGAAALRSAELSTYPPSSTGGDPPHLARLRTMRDARSRDRSRRGKPRRPIDR
jgi:hypothetical protein